MMRERGLGHYVLAHGAAGRARLRILARATEEGTTALFQRLGIAAGMSVLDVGCGGGDVSKVFARLVGSSGRVVGVDLDPIELEAARREAQAEGLEHLSYRKADALALEPDASFHVAYARFLLSHLAAPERAMESMLATLRPGGRLVVEDVDFSGHFCHPNRPAMAEYLQLYSGLVSASGGDPNIGPRLPGLLSGAGLQDIGMHVSQPAGFEGEAKLITPLTMQSIGERVVQAGLATADDVKRIVEELTEAALDPSIVMGMPRIFQVWGRKRS